MSSSAGGADEPAGCRSVNQAGRVDQADGSGCASDHGGGRLAGGAQLADACIAARFTELLAVGFDDERMVIEDRRRRTSEHPGQFDLPSG